MSAFAAALLLIEFKKQSLIAGASPAQENTLFNETAAAEVASPPVASGASNDNFAIVRQTVWGLPGSWLKRFIDISASITLIILASPLALLTALAIKLDSSGPVLYRQKRVGLRGQVFEVFKFRSMIMNAEPEGPQYARLLDDRVTRVGSVIRKFRIDEIPQAINVLRGEMSFVGPRPERPEFVKELEKEIPNYHARHIVKPGITGWAQVKYEYAATVDGAREKLRYDLFYIQNSAPLFDLVIILKTVRVALFGIGSR
ncbi:MAG: hypothetical protein DHS20C05_19670 [Hyphococcus sp.]|nr:MAG: hypothetical protein DHS20C05_19670 [Marinicaulis sp.]